MKKSFLYHRACHGMDKSVEITYRFCFVNVKKVIFSFSDRLTQCFRPVRPYTN